MRVVNYKKHLKLTAEVIADSNKEQKKLEKSREKVFSYILSLRMSCGPICEAHR